MLNTLIIILAAILLPGLLYYENRVNQKSLLLTKTVLSLLFIIAALVQPHPISVYYYCLLVGLTFCLGGDIFLALRQKMMFLFGLIFFLIGHIFYIFGFFYVAKSMDVGGAPHHAGHQCLGLFLAQAPFGVNEGTGCTLRNRYYHHAFRGLVGSWRF
jgi:uncharacterized membrane protein YhhN